MVLISDDIFSLPEQNCMRVISKSRDEGERQRTNRKLPFPSPVFPGLWIEGHGPGQKVNPANHLIDDKQHAAMDDHKVNPEGQTRRKRIKFTDTKILDSGNATIILISGIINTLSKQAFECVFSCNFSIQYIEYSA